MATMTLRVRTERGHLPACSRPWGCMTEQCRGPHLLALGPQEQEGTAEAW